MAEEVAVRSAILDDLACVITTGDKSDLLVRQTNSAFGLLSSIPMRCKAYTCTYSEVCPLVEAKIVEEGTRCAIETTLLRDMFIAYCMELEINPDVDKVKAGLVKDLCSVEIQALRASKLMSFKDFLVDAIEAISPVDGEVYYKKDLHVAIGWSERLLNQKIRILDTLAATPLVRAKYLGGDKKQSILDTIAERRAKAEAMMATDESEDATYDVDWKEEE